MINLLPPETRENIMFARRNTKLLRWSMALLMGAAGIVVVIVFGLFYIDQNTQNISRQVEISRQDLKDKKLEETQKRVEDLSGSLKLVTQVLSKQILFSDLLEQTGAAMPAGSSLAGLNISKIQGGIDLQAAAKDYQTASQVQVNLQDPANKIFEKADILGIVCTPTSVPAVYPCNGSYRAMFTKNNPFLFLKPTTATGAKP